MKTQSLLGFALATAWLGSSAEARADLQCTTVEAYNAAMVGDDATTSLTLEFDVTGVDPADFFGSKGCLAELDDNRCSVGTGMAAANVKVYGPADPPNAAHPAGTIKFEYGNECCASPPCGEGWASPNPSATVFVDGSEHCTVKVWLDPAQYGYSIDCGAGAFEAVGDNVDGLMVNRVALLQRNDGGWAIPNGVSTWNQLCYEPPVAAPGSTSLTVPILEDASVSVGAPDAVYAPVEDLSVEANDSQFYVKFDLGAVPGHVVKAELFLHLSDDPSAGGDGGDLYSVADDTWHESTVTWNARPATQGAALGRKAPLSAFDWYVWDVSSAISDPDVYSFAVVPQPTDANGGHFFSKEASASFAPYLYVEYVVVDADGDGFPDGPDCDDAAPSVFPGATEACNGIDDDCDGDVDEGCAGAGGSGAGGSPATSSDGAAAPASAREDDAWAADESGCGCGAVGRGRHGEPALLLGALACAVRRRRTRAALRCP